MLRFLPDRNSLTSSSINQDICLLAGLLFSETLYVLKTTLETTMHEHLLPSEQHAKDFVAKYTAERCTRLLDALCRRFDRRFELAASNAGVPINREWVRVTPFERELTFRLKMGLTLNNTDTPFKAKIRILKRMVARGGMRGQRAKVNLDEILTNINCDN